MSRRFKTRIDAEGGLLIPAGAVAGHSWVCSDGAGNGVWTAPVAGFVPVGSAFPPAPVDMAQFDLQTLAMGAAGVRWRFAYDASNGWWEFVGGPPLVAESGTLVSTASTSFVNQTDMTMDLPYPGRYDIRVEALAQTAPNVGNSVLMSIAFGAGVGSDQWAASQGTPVASVASALIGSTNRLDVGSSALNIKQSLRSSVGGAGTVQLVRQRKIIVTPVRLVTS